MLSLWDFLLLLRENRDRFSVDDLYLPLGGNNRTLGLIDNLRNYVSAKHALMCKFFKTHLGQWV